MRAYFQQNERYNWLLLTFIVFELRKYENKKKMPLNSMHNSNIVVLFQTSSFRIDQRWIKIEFYLFIRHLKMTTR